MMLKNGLELTLRKAEKGDAPAILEYLNRVGGESDNLLFGKDSFQIPLETEERLIESMNNSETSVMLLGMVNGEIVSIGTLSASKRERIAHLGEIALSVSKKFWRLGIGETMLKSLIQFARQTGKLKTLYLGVRDGNLGAITLYQKLGFVEYGRFPAFFQIHGDYYDEILLYKSI